MIGLVFIMTGLTKHLSYKILIIVRACILATFQEANWFMFGMGTVFFPLNEHFLNAEDQEEASSYAVSDG